MTSSRQSPKRSAVKVGVDLVPLLELHSAHDCNVPVAPYLVIDVPSSSSRDSSASHQMTKLIDEGAEPRFLPVAVSRSGVPRAAHISAPGLSGEMSAATARPVSWPDTIGPSVMMAQVFGSR